MANMVLHVLPALILDLFNVGKEIRFIRITRKMEALMSSFAYFMAKPLNFGNEHMVEIQNRSVDVSRYCTLRIPSIPILFSIPV